jgi:hypothetical protein
MPADQLGKGGFIAALQEVLEEQSIRQVAGDRGAGEPVKVS